MRWSHLLTLVLFFCIASTAGHAACDLCLPPPPPGTPLEELLEPGFQMSVSEQLTYFGTLTRDGREVPNPEGQRLLSSTTQLQLSYNVSRAVAVQVALPYHHRSFRRTSATGVEDGTVSGLGDVVVAARFVPVAAFDDKHSLVWSVTTGLKLPTGDASALASEAAHVHGEHSHHHGGARERLLLHGGEHHHHDEEEHPAEPHHAPPAHRPTESAVHGHDLALGSGSVDGVVGTSVFLRADRFLANAGVNALVRTRGAHDYRFGNAVMWHVAPGVLLYDSEGRLLGLQLRASGEHHGADDVGGVPVSHSGIDRVMLGPELFYSSGSDVLVNAGVELPVHNRAPALQLAPDYRVRFNLLVRF